MHINLIFSDDHTHAHYKQTFEYIMNHVPYLGSLIGKKKKCNELAYIIGEVFEFLYTVAQKTVRMF